MVVAGRPVLVIAAPEPAADPEARKLLHVDPRRGALAHRLLDELSSLLRPGDLLVVNDAATLPASLPARGPSGAPLEVRLAGLGPGDTWSAALFGAGDWRTRTEERPAPEVVSVGDHLHFGPSLYTWGGGPSPRPRASLDTPGGGPSSRPRASLSARVVGVSPVSRRLVELSFDREGASLWSSLYGIGRPVQYSYLRRPLAIEEVQTAYAARPWAAEAPSAGLLLTGRLLLDLRRRGVGLAAVTHAAGLSSTGEPALDAALPLSERFEVDQAAARAVAETRALGGRVVAVGTTVVRALETAAASGREGSSLAGMTDLVIDAGHRLRVVDGLLTGVHEPGTSHFRLLAAFASESLLLEAFSRSEAAGYQLHEFGDAWLILSSAEP